jgi:hypothetical protein
VKGEAQRPPQRAVVEPEATGARPRNCQQCISRRRQARRGLTLTAAVGKRSDSSSSRAARAQGSLSMPRAKSQSRFLRRRTACSGPGASVARSPMGAGQRSSRRSVGEAGGGDVERL